MVKIFLFSTLASLGAASVAWGLYLELLGEKESYRDIDDFRESKTKAHAGLKWVFWGVIAEMVIGFALAVVEGSELIKTNKRIEANDPRNQPLVNASATVMVTFKGSNFVENPLWGGSAIAFLTAYDEAPDSTFISNSVVDGGMRLLTEGFDRVAWMGTYGHSYILQFVQDPTETSLALGSLKHSAGEVFDGIKTVAIDLKFVPNDAEVIDCSVLLLINGALRKDFKIQSQKAYPPHPKGFILGLKAGTGVDTGFTIVTTNPVASLMWPIH